MEWQEIMCAKGGCGEGNQGEYAHAWAHDCIDTRVFGVGFIRYIDSYAHVQQAKTARVQVIYHNDHLIIIICMCNWVPPC